MKGIDKLREYKDKITLIGLATIFLFLTYYLVISPYRDMKYKNDLEKVMGEKVIAVQKELDNIEKIYQKRLEENKKAEEKYKQYEEQLIKRSFENTAIFDEFIQKKAEDNQLLIKSIGSIETSNSSKKGKVYISYEIEGNSKNIKNFIKELENTEKLVSLTENKLLLENKDGKIRITLKISGYILNIISEKKDTCIDEEKKLHISFLDLDISEFKIIELNEKKYAVVKFKNGSRKIIYHGEKIKIDEKIYRAVIKADGIYLENGEKK